MDCLLTTAGLLHVFFLYLASFEQVFAFSAHFETANGAAMFTGFAWGFGVVAASAHGQNLTALLNATRKATENRLKTFAFFAFYFNCSHEFTFLSIVGWVDSSLLGWFGQF
jgi:hypothetical protein